MVKNWIQENKWSCLLEVTQELGIGLEMKWIVLIFGSVKTSL